MDPNITGRNCRHTEWNMKPFVKKIVVLGLTRASHGNATGIGSADVITLRLYRDLDVASTYANVITAANLDGAAIPVIMNTDREAIALAVKTVVRVKPADCRVVHIRNTLHLSEIAVSQALLAEVRAQPERFELLSEALPPAFDAQGNLERIAHAVEAAA
jgi:hypothetical protein